MLKIIPETQCVRYIRYLHIYHNVQWWIEFSNIRRHFYLNRFSNNLFKFNRIERNVGYMVRYKRGLL